METLCATRPAACGPNLEVLHEPPHHGGRGSDALGGPREAVALTGEQDIFYWRAAPSEAMLRAQLHLAAQTFAILRRADGR
jgi:hypothetical protein